jgi:hypothetical protein
MTSLDTHTPEYALPSDTELEGCARIEPTNNADSPASALILRRRLARQLPELSALIEAREKQFKKSEEERARQLDLGLIPSVLLLVKTEEAIEADRKAQQQDSSHTQ